MMRQHTKPLAGIAYLVLIAFLVLLSVMTFN